MAELAAEYFDDGSSFFAVDPLSINPESLTDFSLFERYAHGNGQYRFRCLLVDSSSIPRERLIKLLASWGVVYIHSNQNRNYIQYVKKNLEFILKREGIDVKNKTGILISLATEVVQESFSINFASQDDCNRAIKNIEKLISQAVDFISDIESLNGIANLIGHDYQTHTHSIKVGWLTATFINANPDLFEAKTDGQFRDLMIQAAAAGFLHDIGKIKIPKNVINKKGKFNNLEIRAHAVPHRLFHKSAF